MSKQLTKVEIAKAIIEEFFLRSYEGEFLGIRMHYPPLILLMSFLFMLSTVLWLIDSPKSNDIWVIFSIPGSFLLLFIWIRYRQLTR